jgi:hypothetical protein
MSRMGSRAKGKLCEEEVVVDLVPSDVRVIGIVVVVVVVVEIVAWK